MEGGGGVLTKLSHLDLFNKLPNPRLIFLIMRRQNDGGLDNQRLKEPEIGSQRGSGKESSNLGGHGVGKEEN